MNKLNYSLTTLFNELQTYESMHTKDQMERQMLPVPLKSSTEVRPLELSLLLPLPKKKKKNWKKKKGNKGGKTNQVATQKASKGLGLQKEIVSIALKMGTGSWTVPNIWQKKRRQNKVNMIY